MKPVIGMLAEVDDDRVSRMLYPYAKVIEESGGLPVLLPYVNDPEALARFVALCDGFCFTGGADMHPSYYREEMLPVCGTVYPCRDTLEMEVFPLAFSSQKPILGICRGAQIINVALGGTLYQDIPTQLQTDISHRQTEPRFSFSHDVKVLPGTPLHNLVGKDRIRANSFHHQAVKDLGQGLSVMALADDGVIEAMYLEGTQYLRAYQWHPERLFDVSDENRAIFDDFIRAC